MGREGQFRVKVSHDLRFTLVTAHDSPDHLLGIIFVFPVKLLKHIVEGDFLEFLDQDEMIPHCGSSKPLFRLKHPANKIKHSTIKITIKLQ